MRQAAPAAMESKRSAGRSGSAGLRICRQSTQVPDQFLSEGCMALMAIALAVTAYVVLTDPPGFA
jgi:hypothetical protein